MKTFWDNKSVDAQSDLEVIVTLQNFSYLTSKRKTCDALFKVVHPLFFCTS